MRDYNHRTRWNGACLALLLALAFAPVTGCATKMAAQAGIPATDRSTVTLGASREVVESALGAPIERQGNASTYEYNRGWQHPNMHTPGHPGNIMVGAAVDVMTLGIVSTRYYAQQYRAQRTRTTILFSPSDTVTSLDIDVSRRHFETWILSNDRTASLRDLCLAANGGYAPAQYEEALRHRYGLWGTQSDLVKAVFWVKLADFGGHPEAAATLADWSRELSVPERDLVQSKFRTWTPDTCDN